MNVRFGDVVLGAAAGVLFMCIVVTLNANAIQTEAIKMYQEGKIECATVGNDFVCRERNK